MKLTFVMRLGSCAAVLLLLLATSAHGQGGRTKVAAQSLDKIFAAEWDYDMEQYPKWASTLGDRRWNHRWEDLSMDAILKRHERHREVLARLGKMDRAALSSADRLNYDKEDSCGLSSQRKQTANYGRQSL